MTTIAKRSLWCSTGILGGAGLTALLLGGVFPFSDSLSDSLILPVGVWVAYVLVLSCLGNFDGAGKGKAALIWIWFAVVLGLGLLVLHATGIDSASGGSRWALNPLFLIVVLLGAWEMAVRFAGDSSDELSEWWRRFGRRGAEAENQDEEDGL